MLENGKMGRLRQVFKGIFKVIRGHRPANLDYRNRLCVTSGNDRGKNSNVYLSSVINGLRPVNLKDCWNRLCITSGNNRSEKCVAKRFAGLCPRMTVDLVSPSRGEVLKHVLFSQCAPDATGFLSDVYSRGTRARKFLADGVQCGRSMIEMLGVLAIVGVLSVTGLAGYSKAMERFKINKTISEYNTLMFGFFQHLDDIRKLPDDDASSPYPFSDLLVSLDLVPPSWGVGGKWLNDSLGNYFRIYPTFIEVVFNASDRSAGDKQILFCRELFSTIAKGYQDVLSYAFIWRSNQPSDLYYGNKFCDIPSRCIRNMTFDDIDKQCQKCNNTDGNKTCSLVLHF